MVGKLTAKIHKFADGILIPDGMVLPNVFKVSVVSPDNPLTK